MKLKKIVSLALAGVLAVSMLAGCKNGTGSSSSTTEQKPADTLTDSVIAQLTEDTTKKVTFTYDAGLKGTAEKIVAYYGANNSDLTTSISGNEATVLKTVGVKADDTDALLYDSKGDYAKEDSKEQTMTYVTFVKTSDANFTAKQIAAALEKLTAVDGTHTMAELPATGAGLKADVNSQAVDCQYNFKYTGKMAVVAVDDEYGYNTGYLAVFSVTRTGTKVDI